tara:strand:+ start:264 stop:557 length:294 start_codon:yes stop_codon:yes gene_type:complete
VTTEKENNVLKSIFNIYRLRKKGILIDYLHGEFADAAIKIKRTGVKTEKVENYITELMEWAHNGNVPEEASALMNHTMYCLKLIEEKGDTNAPALGD